ELHDVRVEVSRVALMRQMSADWEGMRPFEVGQRLRQIWKRGWRESLVASAPQEQGRLGDARKVQIKGRKRAWDVVNARGGAFVIQRGLIADVFRQDV